MCRYLAVQEGVGDHKVIAAEHDYNKIADAAEKAVLETGKPVEIFERVSTAKPTTAVSWEGKRRPAISNGS